MEYSSKHGALILVVDHWIPRAKTAESQNKNADRRLMFFQIFHFMSVRYVRCVAFMSKHQQRTYSPPMCCMHDIPSQKHHMISSVQQRHLHFLLPHNEEKFPATHCCAHEKPPCSSGNWSDYIKRLSNLTHDSARGTFCHNCFESALSVWFPSVAYNSFVHFIDDGGSKMRHLLPLTVQTSLQTYLCMQFELHYYASDMQMKWLSYDFAEYGCFYQYWSLWTTSILNE